MANQSTRYVSYDSKRPPVAVGVKIDITNPDPGASITRVMNDKFGNYLEGAAVDAIFHVNTASSPYVSSFDTFDEDANAPTGGDGLMPWCGMKRAMVNITSDIDSFYGEIDDYGNLTYTDSSGMGKIFVYVPKFWYKFYVSGNYRYHWISPYPMQGYRLHPAFLRAQNPIDYIMIGAYEGWLSNGVLYSGANNAPTISTARADCRNGANLMGAAQGGGTVQRYELLDLQAWSALQWLYLIEYANLNCQTPSGSTARGGLSAGINTGANRQYTGWTSSYTMTNGSYHNIDLGNASGQVQVAAGPIYAMSYRGVENLWGNTWTMLDAHEIDTNRNLWVRYNQQGIGAGGAATPLADYTTAQLLNTGVNTQFQVTGLGTLASTGYVNAMSYDAGYHETEWMPFWPATVTGSANTYWCGTYTTGSTAAERFLIVGGSYTNGTEGGIWAMNTILGFSDTGADVGSRIMLTPYFLRDTSFYHY
jgi:hypothetical protein